MVGPEHAVGLAAKHGAHGAVAGGHEQRAGPAGQHHRRAGKRAVGVLTSACLGSGFLSASFFRASAIGSGAACAGLRVGVGGLNSGGGGVSVAALMSFFASFAVGSSTGLASAIFSTSGLG